jgi:hypothetical protein
VVQELLYRAQLHGDVHRIFHMKVLVDAVAGAIVHTSHITMKCRKMASCVYKFLAGTCTFFKTERL